MIASITSDLLVLGLWGAATFVFGVEIGLLLAQRNPPDDGDSSGGQSRVEERL